MPSDQVFPSVLSHMIICLMGFFAPNTWQCKRWNSEAFLCRWTRSHQIPATIQSMAALADVQPGAGGGVGISTLPTQSFGDQPSSER
jgi:hypothetical protein